MTWNEFKKQVEEQMAATGLTGDETLLCVDVFYPDEAVGPEPLTVEIHPGDRVSIS